MKAAKAKVATSHDAKERSPSPPSSFFLSGNPKDHPKDINDMTAWNWTKDFLASVGTTSADSPLSTTRTSKFGTTASNGTTKINCAEQIAHSMDLVQNNFYNYNYAIVELESYKLYEIYCAYNNISRLASSSNIGKHSIEKIKPHLFYRSIYRDLQLLLSVGCRYIGISPDPVYMHKRPLLVDAFYRVAQTLCIEIQKDFPAESLRALTAMTDISPLLLWLRSIGLESYFPQFLQQGYANLYILNTIGNDIRRGKDIDGELGCLNLKPGDLRQLKLSLHLLTDEAVTALIHQGEMNSKVPSDKDRSVHVILETQRVVSSRQVELKRMRTVPHKVLIGHTNYVTSVCMSLDALTVVSGSCDYTIKVWHTSKSIMEKTLTGHDDFIWSVACSHDGTIIASASSDKTVRIWETEESKCIRVLRGHAESVLSVSMVANGTKVVSGSCDHTVRLWDVIAGSCLRVMKGHTNAVRAVCISSCGSKILSGSYDRSVRVWQVNPQTLRDHASVVTSVCFTNDMKSAISGSCDKSIRVWNLETYLCIRILRGHTDHIWSVCCSIDDRLITSASNDGSICVWAGESSSTNSYLRKLTGHEQYVLAVAIRNIDGHSLIASGGVDGTVRLWT